MTINNINVDGAEYPADEFKDPAVKALLELKEQVDTDAQYLFEDFNEKKAKFEYEAKKLQALSFVLHSELGKVVGAELAARTEVLAQVKADGADSTNS